MVEKKVSKKTSKSKVTSKKSENKDYLKFKDTSEVKVSKEL